jgi:hypothetical protein
LIVATPLPSIRFTISGHPSSAFVPPCSLPSHHTARDILTEISLVSIWDFIAISADVLPQLMFSPHSCSPSTSIPFIGGKSSATLFFGNLSLDMDDKTLKTQIEMFTGGSGEGQMICISLLTVYYGSIQTVMTMRGERTLCCNCHDSLDLSFQQQNSSTFITPSRIQGPGSVASVRFPTDKDSQRSKGYAFVDIHRVSDAKRVSMRSSAVYLISEVKCSGTEGNEISESYFRAGKYAARTA